MYWTRLDFYSLCDVIRPVDFLFSSLLMMVLSELSLPLSLSILHTLRRDFRGMVFQKQASSCTLHTPAMPRSLILLCTWLTNWIGLCHLTPSCPSAFFAIFFLCFFSRSLAYDLGKGACFPRERNRKYRSVSLLILFVFQSVVIITIITSFILAWPGYPLCQLPLSHRVPSYCLGHMFTSRTLFISSLDLAKLAHLMYIPLMS